MIEENEYVKKMGEMDNITDHTVIFIKKYRCIKVQNVKLWLKLSIFKDFKIRNYRCFCQFLTPANLKGGGGGFNNAGSTILSIIWAGEGLF